MAEDSSFDDSATETNGSAGPTPTMKFGRRIFQTFLDLMDLQVQIIVLRLLARARNILLILFLAGLAAIAFLVGVIFAYIAVYRALLKLLPGVWVDVVFAGFHFLLALILIRALLNNRQNALRESHASDDQTGENL